MSTAIPEAVNTPEVMRTELTPTQQAARERIYAMPLEKLDPANPFAFANEEMWWKFERLRAEDPVHFTAAEHTWYGNYGWIT